MEICLVMPKIYLIVKFLCLLNLPAANLEWSASFYSLSLPSRSRGQFLILPDIAACQVAQTAKNLTAMQNPGLILESGRPLEKGMATHSTILAWRIPWTEEPGGLKFMALQTVRQTKQLTLSLMSENT